MLPLKTRITSEWDKGFSWMSQRPAWRNAIMPQAVRAMRTPMTTRMWSAQLLIAIPSLRTRRDDRTPACKQPAMAEPQEYRLAETKARENLPRFSAGIGGKGPHSRVVQKIVHTVVIGLLEFVHGSTQKQMLIQLAAESAKLAARS